MMNNNKNNNDLYEHKINSSDEMFLKKSCKKAADYLYTSRS